MEQRNANERYTSPLGRPQILPGKVQTTPSSLEGGEALSQSQHRFLPTQELVEYAPGSPNEK